MVRKRTIVKVATVVAAGGLYAARRKQTTSRQEFEGLLAWLKVSNDEVPKSLRQQYNSALLDCLTPKQLRKLLTWDELDELEVAYATRDKATGKSTSDQSEPKL